MIRHENESGSVNVSTGVYMDIVGTAAANCFGVKGMAARNSDFDGYNIHEGDYLAMCDKGLFGTSQAVRVLLKSLAEKVRDEEKEYITIYYGADTKEKHAQKAADIFADICPNADVNLINGGQPVYYYLISAE